MISVVDLAFEIWFADSGESEKNKQTWRRKVWDPMFAQGKFSEGMERALRHAITVLRLAGQGFFIVSPVGSPTTDGTVH